MVVKWEGQIGVTGQIMRTTAWHDPGQRNEKTAMAGCLVSRMCVSPFPYGRVGGTNWPSAGGGSGAGDAGAGPGSPWSGQYAVGSVPAT
jgi:hypothetical protein